MAARARRTAPATAETRCGACRAPLIRQTGGVLDITADATPIPHGTDVQVREPNRLTWCRPTPRHGTGPPPLQWVYPSHPPDCPHPHHADHRCTTPRTPEAPFEQAPPNALF
jgi:hypothetical protein